MVALVALCAFAQVRQTVPADLPPELRTVDLAAVRAESTRRVESGERDHMVFYALQSSRFTALPRIEPAVSARDFVQQGAIPRDAAARLVAFLTAEPRESRHVYFRTLVTADEQLLEAYRSAMRFLYEKEWESRPKSGGERRDFIAGLYQKRAHSTDSAAAANYAIHSGLSTLAGARIRRVLVIGPGMDIAPRTALDDSDPPQSLQPYLVADTLLRLGLAQAGDLRVDCADINPRVLRHLREFPQSGRRLRVKAARGDDEWNEFFDTAGSRIGKRLPDGWIEVSREAAAAVAPLEMNILTDRSERPAYDLAIATNVLLYFNGPELGLAFANTAAGLVPGGHFLHNDTRAAVEDWARIFSLPAEGARMVRLASPPGRDLFDAAVIHTRR